MSKSSGRAGEGGGREKPHAAQQRRAGGDRAGAAAEEEQHNSVKRYVDYLPEVLIEHALSYEGELRKRGSPSVVLNRVSLQCFSPEYLTIPKESFSF